MLFELDNTERELLSSLKDGLAEIRVYKAGLYPTAVSFVLNSGNIVTVRAIGEGVAPRFEVFPISVTAQVLSVEPEQVIDCGDHSDSLELAILRKAEWSVSSTQEEKSQMLGDTEGATTQYEGKASDIPKSAISHVSLDAGVEIRGADGWSFLIATSMFPFALYVSDCAFSESADPSIYDRLSVN